MVITKYKDEHIFCSVLQDHTTLHAKPRHVLIDTESKSHSWSNFVMLIKVSHDDDVNSIDDKIQNAFDEFSDYSDAVKKFGNNLEAIINKTKKMLDDAIVGNLEYDKESKEMLKMCQEIINNKMELNDIQDMLLQHILTYRIFALVYDEHDFHNTNTVAKSLEKLKEILDIDTSEIKYDKMELIAESITDSDQRQEFLKRFYETFYEKYDPAKAKKDGIVYTPNEVVNFMVTTTEQLLKKHFGTSISNDNVTILDPATGTGTFLVHILSQISTDKIESKYTKEIHANEISILPYYIATLNIEHTYKELTGKYREFENICWIDTLDSGIKDYSKLTAYIEGNDNVKRITKQQKSKIHVIIGNPPYNAIQSNLNNANAKKKYPHIDKKIYDEWSIYSTAQNKNNSQDMYKRFLKWSSERIHENGMVVFVSNNMFLNARADDGFRKAMHEEFDHIYTINLKGNSKNIFGDNARKEGGNVFDVQVGITITFFIKTGQQHSEFQYAEIEDYMTKERKLEWINKQNISTLKFQKIIPDTDFNWLNQTENDFNELLPLLPRNTRESIFEISSTGITTGKDEWAYDIIEDNLGKKIKYYTSCYNNAVENYKTEYLKIANLAEWSDKKIKWSDRTFQCLKQKRKIIYSSNCIIHTLCRPFIIRYQYYDTVVTHRQAAFQNIFKNSQNNLLISFKSPKINSVFCTLATNLINDYDLLYGTQNIALWKYDDEGKKHSNVSDWGLKQFISRYKNKEIVKDDIFYYVYAMFNDPKYGKTYRYNLERDFPQVPFAKNFMNYSRIGKKLFEIHCNFMNAKEYGLKRIDKNTSKNSPRLVLKKDNNNTKILIDEQTILENIPNDVFEYEFNGRTPLHWILLAYKEKQNKMSSKSCNDENIRNKFNTYQFADHKEELITLLEKVTTVCVETVRLRKELEQLEWGPQSKLKLTPIAKKPTKKSKPKKYISKIKVKPKAKPKVIKPKKTKSSTIGKYF